MKHTPQRTCIVCRKKHDKQGFIKIVKQSDGTIKIAEQKDSGRGAYICKTAECVNKCIKTKALNRAFKMPVDESVYAALLELVNKA